MGIYGTLTKREGRETVLRFSKHCVRVFHHVIYSLYLTCIPIIFVVVCLFQVKTLCNNTVDSILTMVCLVSLHCKTSRLLLLLKQIVSAESIVADFSRWDVCKLQLDLWL